MDRKPRVLSLAFVLTLICASVAAVPRPASPQLVGIKRVALALSLPHHPSAAETDALSKEIASQLAKVGIRVDASAPMMLAIRVTRREIPACAELVAFRASAGLWEDVRLRRGDRSFASRVETWSTEHELDDAASREGIVARDSVMRVVKIFADEVEYAEMWKDR